jgi:hypothetical protein
VDAAGAFGAGSGRDGGVFVVSRHQFQRHPTEGSGFLFLFAFFDCCLLTSAMMSSTGRFAGHELTGGCWAGDAAVSTRSRMAHCFRTGAL